MPSICVTRLQSPTFALMLLWKRKDKLQLDTCTSFPVEDTEQTSQTRLAMITMQTKRHLTHRRTDRQFEPRAMDGQTDRCMDWQTDRHMLTCVSRDQTDQTQRRELANGHCSRAGCAKMCKIVVPHWGTLKQVIWHAVLTLTCMELAKICRGACSYEARLICFSLQLLCFLTLQHHGCESKPILCL